MLLCLQYCTLFNKTKITNTLNESPFNYWELPHVSTHCTFMNFVRQKELEVLPPPPCANTKYVSRGIVDRNYNGAKKTPNNLIQSAKTICINSFLPLSFSPPPWSLGGASSDLSPQGLGLGWSDIALYCDFRKTGTLLPIGYIFKSAFLKNRWVWLYALPEQNSHRTENRILK